MAEPMALAYEERGHGPVLLLVHGFPFDRTMWIDQLAGLAKIRRVVAVDLRGHGLSHDPNPADYSIDLFADDLVATLDEIGAEKADIGGLSMGGYVAFALWRRHPERIRSLILACTKAEADSPEGRDAREKTAALVREQGMEPLYDRLIPKLLRATPSDAVRDRLRAIMLRVPPEVAAADSLAMRDRPDSTGDLEGITVPTLWIAGAEDATAPPDGARASAARIPGARFVEVPGAGHLAPMENPAAFNDALRAFLTQTP